MLLPRGFWLALLLTVLPAVSAYGEGVLISVQPGDGAPVDSYDGRVRLWFSGNISERAPTLIVLDAAGNRVDHGDMRLTIGEHSELSATTGALPSGAYVIRYRVLTRDGLVVSGIRRFAVRS